MRLIEGELSLKETAIRVCLTGFYCSCWFVFDSLRRVTGPGGQLDQLGAGTVQISAKARAALRRWSASLGGVTVLLAVAVFYFNVPLIISGASHQGRHDATDFPACTKSTAADNDARAPPGPARARAQSARLTTSCVPQTTGSPPSAI